jgi:CubicO group peptidase (beta-lactamase class C family)
MGFGKMKATNQNSKAMKTAASLLLLLFFSVCKPGQTAASDGERLYADVEKYVSFGDHRTATAADAQTAQWLGAELTKQGYAVNYPEFPLRQYFFDRATITGGRDTISVFPQWWVNEHIRQPVEGQLIAVSSASADPNGKIALLTVAEGRIQPVLRLIDTLTKRGAAAAVIITENLSGEVEAFNAAFRPESLPGMATYAFSPKIPVVLAAAGDRAKLSALLANRQPVRLSVIGEYRDVRGKNVYGAIGTGKKHIVISTPISGWFGGGGERGPGVAVWLALARWAATLKTDYTFVFTGHSGHEIGGLGAHLFLDKLAPPVEDTHLWIHLGAGLATRATRQTPNGLAKLGEADSLRNFFYSAPVKDAFLKAFEKIKAQKFDVKDRNAGELIYVAQKGYPRILGVSYAHPWFHTPADSASCTSPRLLAEVASAFRQFISEEISEKKRRSEEIIAIVREAYLYAAPMIYTDVTRITSSAPDNRLNYMTKFPDHTFKHVVAPNNDTNYSTAFLDLTGEPVVIEIPDVRGRYYVFPLQDAWTNNFFLPGTRTTGSGKQKYLITGPSWKGEVPKGLTPVSSPTNLVWAIGRIQVNSREDQEKEVIPLQKKFLLQPLSQWLAKDTAPVAAKKRQSRYQPTNLQGKTVVEIIKSLPIERYFSYFNDLLMDNPPFAADSATVARMATVGIGAGKHFSLADFDRETQEALNRLTANIYKEMDELYPRRKNETAGDGAKTGDYKTNYYARALVAYKGLGALPPEEAVYYIYTGDGGGETLNGSTGSYRIRFEKGQTPPAQAFWSYTVYGKDRYLVDNPIKRYAIGDRSNLKYNADGSLDLYLSYRSPGKEKEANWLPIPNDEFIVTLRIYLPKEEFLKNRSLWKDPLPEKAGAAQQCYFPPAGSDEWETLSPQSLRWNQAAIDSLYSYLEAGNAKAFILLKDGKMVLEKYFSGHTKDSLWYWASAGKSLTAFLVGLAQQEGYLAISDTVSKYLGTGWTSETPEQEGKITIRHQLTMTSGLDEGAGIGPCTNAACLTYKADAGARWAYHNAPYTLLDSVVQKASGKTLNEWVQLKLKAQTGVAGRFHRAGYNKIFFSTARSMARYGLLVLNKGSWSGVPVMTDTGYFHQMLTPSQPLNQSYGYLWWLNGRPSYMQPQTRKVFRGPLFPDAPADVVAALGMNGQIIHVSPGRNMVVVRMGMAPDTDETAAVSSSLSNQIWRFISKMTNDKQQ